MISLQTMSLEAALKTMTLSEAVTYLTTHIEQFDEAKKYLQSYEGVQKLVSLCVEPMKEEMLLSIAGRYDIYSKFDRFACLKALAAGTVWKSGYKHIRMMYAGVKYPNLPYDEDDAFVKVNALYNRHVHTPGLQVVPFETLKGKNLHSFDIYGTLPSNCVGVDVTYEIQIGVRSATDVDIRYVEVGELFDTPNLLLPESLKRKQGKIQRFMEDQISNPTMCHIYSVSVFRQLLVQVRSFIQPLVTKDVYPASFTFQRWDEFGTFDDCDTIDVSNENNDVWQTFPDIVANFVYDNTTERVAFYNPNDSLDVDNNEITCIMSDNATVFKLNFHCMKLRFL